MYEKLVTPEVFPQKECLADHTALNTENFQSLKEAQLRMPITARDNKSASMMDLTNVLTSGSVQYKQTSSLHLLSIPYNNDMELDCVFGA
jgi:hypothetical protein